MSEPRNYNVILPEYMTFVRLSKKKNEIYNCCLCKMSDVTDGHRYTPKHVKAERWEKNEFKYIGKNNDALFFEFYPQTFIQLKYIPWRVKMQK